jgi:hypothetical protein
VDGKKECATVVKQTLGQPSPPKICHTPVQNLPRPVAVTDLLGAPHRRGNTSSEIPRKQKHMYILYKRGRVRYECAHTMYDVRPWSHRAGMILHRAVILREDVATRPHQGNGNQSLRHVTSPKLRFLHLLKLNR